MIRRLWQGLVNGLLVLVLVGVGAPTVAQPEAVGLAASGVYTEDFSSYTRKDFEDRANWNIWEKTLSLARPDGPNQQSPAIAMDVNGNAMIVWTDNRGGKNSYDCDIYARSISSDGNRLWAADVLVNSDNGTAGQYSPVVAVDVSGNIFVVWVDSRNGNYDIYAQRLSADGTRLWGIDMLVNSDGGTGNYQYTPAVAIDGNGNALVVWRDQRNGNNDIYAQRLNVNGARLWPITRCSLITATPMSV